MYFIRIFIFALVAEAVVGGAFFDKLFSVAAVKSFAFALDVGADAAIFIGAFVMFKSGAFQRGINNFDGVFDITRLVGIFNTQDEFALS